MAILRAYTYGLKGPVWAYAFAPLRATLNITFQERQALMVDIDEELQQTQPQRQYTTAPQLRVVMNNLVINLPSTGASAPLAPWGQTPIKVEAACQYTHLTREEHEELRWIGGCFHCRQQGHMVHQCPCVAQVAAATPAPTTSALAPAPAPSTTDSTPVMDF